MELTEQAKPRANGCLLVRPFMTDGIATAACITEFTLRRARDYSKCLGAIEMLSQHHELTRQRPVFGEAIWAQDSCSLT